MSADIRAIDAIVIGPRFRKDHGDIDGLAACDPRALGLLHPVVITPYQQPVCAAGSRRLHACRALGWSEIPVRVVDLENLIAGEAAENFCRKDFTQSELAEIQRVILEHWSVARKAGQGKRTDLTSTQTAVEVGKPAPVENTTEQVARLFGESEHTTRKRLAVADAAKAEPDKYGKLLVEMDRIDRVNAVHRRLVAMQQGKRDSRRAAAAAVRPLPGRRLRSAVVFRRPRR